MAVLDAILVPSQEDATRIAAVAASASTAAQSLGKNQLFAIQGTDTFHIAFGVSAMGAADINDFQLPGGQVHVFDTGQAFTDIRLFNSTGSPIDIYIQPLSRF